MNVFLVVAAAFLITGAGMIYAPIMPTHAQQLGAPAWVLTSIPMGLPSIMALILLLPIGVYADNTGKRREILILAAILTLLANVGLAYVNTWPLLTLLRLLSGITFAFLSLYGVLVAFMLPEEKRGMAVALGLGGAMLGMGFFQAISGSLTEALGGFRGLYLFAAVLAGVGALCLLFVKAPVVKNPSSMSLQGILEVIGNKVILATGLALCVYLIGWQMMYGSFPVVMGNVLNVPMSQQSLFFAVASIMLGFGTFIWGPIIDKIGAKGALLVGLWISTVATLAIIPLSSKMWPYVILFWIATLGGVAGNPGGSTIATKAVKKEQATLAMNTLFIFVTLPGVIGGAVAGPLLNSSGLNGMLIAATILECLGALLVMRVPKQA
jgi:MFS family permease